MKRSKRSDGNLSKLARKPGMITRTKSTVGINHIPLATPKKSKEPLYRSLSSLPTMKSKVIITIFSNYGDGSVVSASEIAFFSKNGNRIPISKIQTEPDDDSPENLFRLVTGSMIKLEDEKLWEHQWPLYRNKPLKLIFQFGSLDELDNIRIWQPSDEQKGIRDIEVKLNFSHFWSGELNPTFSTTIRKQNDNNSVLTDSYLSKFVVDQSLLCPDHDNEDPTSYSDDFGRVPIKPMKELRIAFTDTYDHTQSCIIQSILIFGLDGKLLPMDRILKIELHNGRAMEPPKNLFEEKKGISQTKDLYTGWMCERNCSTDPPTLVITFDGYTFVSAISLINPIPLPNQLDISVKNFIIYADGIQIYCGKLPTRIDSETHGNEFRRVIYLHDSPSVQKTVYDQVTPVDISQNLDSFYNALIE